MLTPAMKSKWVEKNQVYAPRSTDGWVCSAFALSVYSCRFCQLPGKEEGRKDSRNLNGGAGDDLSETFVEYGELPRLRSPR